MPFIRPTPGHRALRRGRWSQGGQVYLITTVAFDRQRLFEGWALAAAAASVLANADTWHPSKLLCWVLMPDHWHGLLQLDPGADLAKTVGLAKGRTARTVNQDCNRTGALWSEGFHDRALRRDDCIVNAARYVVANPVRAGLAQKAGDYPFWNSVWLK